MFKIFKIVNKVQFKFNLLEIPLKFREVNKFKKQLCFNNNLKVSLEENSNSNLISKLNSLLN